MKFVRNPQFEVEVGKDIEPALRRSAQEAAAKAEVLAHHAMPRRSRRPIEVTTVDGDVAIANTNHGGAIEEWGSKNSPPYAPLRRGVRAAGLRLSEH